MVGRQEHGSGDDEDVAVDAALEQDLGAVEESVRAYLEDPSARLRNDLLAALERLDQQIDESDAYEGSIIGSGAFGAPGKGLVIGETAGASAAEEVPESVWRAQTALIKAAKREIAAATPDTLADLRAAADALSAARSKEPPTR